MAEDNYISVPVAELEAMSSQVDAAADEIDTSRRRVDRDTTEAFLSDDDPAFSPSRLRSRLGSTNDGLRRVAAQMRATAGLMADSATLAVAADKSENERSSVDSPVQPTNDVVDRLSGHADPNRAGKAADPGWQQAWQAANDNSGD